MVEHFGHSACFEHSYGADLGTNELIVMLIILIPGSFFYDQSVLL